MSCSIYWVYILLCENNSYYTGCTNNIHKRYEAHVEGTAKCKYTRSFKPIKIAQSWEVPNGKIEAMKIERYIKKLSRLEKEMIIVQPSSLHTLMKNETNNVENYK